MSQENGDAIIADVAVNRPLGKSYCYKLECLPGRTLRGCRVKINFAGAETIGIVTGISQTPISNREKLKQAILIDEMPILSDDIMQTLSFASHYYHYPFGQCMCQMLPKILRDGGKFSYETIPGLKLIENTGLDKSKVRSKEQLNILHILKDGAVKRKELRERGISSQSELSLIKKGFIQKIDLKPIAVRWTNSAGILREVPPQLNAEQEFAVISVCSSKGFKAFLLNGVTGSGKTEVYLRIIEKILEKKQSVLVLVPEIALTPQTFSRFYQRFKVPVSSMHSALSDRERLDAYMDMSLGAAAILIGTRTALFTPIPNLGLIVIDEEHDSSFKQTDGLRYHARSLALIRAKICNCPIVMGSATPSLESFYNVKKGIFSEIRLTMRAGNAALPEFEITDLRNEPLSLGLKTGICKSLEDKIGEETAKGNQALLFLNRRGYSHHLLCHHCGNIMMCPRCDNVLTVHKSENKLICHVCEYSSPIFEYCPKCGGKSLIESGFGTEQVEEFLKQRYPDTGVERIDRDSVSSKIELEQKLSRIRSGKSQIMLGTQILAKGHDFPNVTLVGILDIDSSLFNDDFHSLENTLQLLIQVSGRAGRSTKAGKVLLQTHQPDNFFIRKITDPRVCYADIADLLLNERQKMHLPPFSCQAFLLCSSVLRRKAYDYLYGMLNRLKTNFNNFHKLTVTQVMSDKMEKRQNRYHFHILVTADNRKILSDFLDAAEQQASSFPPGSDVRFAVEVDPITMY